MKVHRLYRKKNCEVDLEAPLGAGGAQLQLAAASDHVVENLIERELILARPVGDQLANLGSIAPQEARGQLAALVARIVREETAQVAVVDVGITHEITPALLFVILAERHRERRQRVRLRAIA